MVSVSSRREQDILPIALKRSHQEMPPRRTLSAKEIKTMSDTPPQTRRSDGYRRAISGDGSVHSTSLKNQQIDKFGFITNIDANGKLQPPSAMKDSSVRSRGEPATPEEISEEKKRKERREKKWNSMVESWDQTNRRRQKLVLNRLRKGLPDSMRGKVWPLLGSVPAKMRPGSSTKGIYKALLKQCEDDNRNALDHFPPEGPNQSMSQGLAMIMPRSNSFQNIQETIERDIHRTFPRHSLFYDEENHKDDLPPPPKPPPEEQQSNKGSDDDDDDDSQQALGALCNEDFTTLMRELDVTSSSPFEGKKKKGGSANKTAKKNGAATDEKKKAANTTNNEVKKKGKAQTCETIVEQKGGQAALRRVLCAYSYYDREVGYCQGMNFIAAMFITMMPEEEAFWMLVAVMNDSPCHMRGLFGKGMSETHKVLFVAEKLLHHFLPRLAKHLDKENVHVTMYATQWLLTQYTSSFNFDLVVRVWDCFLVEGFKTIYRVMLALLQQVQPTLLKLQFEEILGFFRDLPDQVEGNEIMETAMKIPLKRKHIAKYENEWLEQQNNTNGSS